jgi:predicted nucleic acid-binding protein
MSYLVDTDIIVDYLRGNQMAADYLDSLRNEWSISAITGLEAIAGARNQREISDIDIIVSAYPAIPPNGAITRRAYYLLKTYAKSHGLRTLDALIAATAFEDGLTLATRNRKHFLMIDGLRIEVPQY